MCALFFATTVSAVDLPFTKDLFEGMPANEEVHRLSIVLKKEGFYIGELTKVYTPMITRAVSAFQAQRGIVPVNGIVGTKTRYELNKIVLGWLGKTIPASETKKTTPTTPVIAKKATTPVVAPKTQTTTTKTSTTKPQSCVHRGKTFKHGEKVRLYKYTAARQGGACPSMVRRCNDGHLEGDLSYRHHACTLASTTFTETDNTTKLPTQKLPTLDGETTKETTTKTTTTTTTTTKKDDGKLTSGCKAGGVQFSVGATTQGCIGPGRSDPTTSQCLAALMPLYKCEMSGNWTCIDRCQFNYY